MARGFQGAVLRGFGARDHEVEVTGSIRLAPDFLRVRMTSPTLFQDAVALPTAWLRFWFPDPAGSSTEFQRAYTITEANETSGDFAVDFVLHEPAGPASQWAVQATPGQTISVTSLGSSTFEVPDEPPAGYLLVGDSASIPAINGILATVPSDVPIELYLEQHSDNDLLIPLTPHPMVRTQWVPRTDANALATAIEARDWSDWSSWLAPESSTLKHVRARLREFGFPKSEMHARAYWIHGRAMGKLRGEKGDAVNAAQPEAQEQAPAEVNVAGELDPAAVSPSAHTRQKPPTAVPTGGSAPQAPASSWRAQAAGRLLAPLRTTLVAAGVLQGIITLLQLAPFVLLVELSRLLLTGAPAPRLWTVGIWALALLGIATLLSSALLLWLHVVDARFSRDLRQRLLGKLARVPLGWFSDRGSGSVKQLVQDDTLSLHYLVTHAVPDAVAAVVAPVAVLAYLFWADWRLALVLLLPVLVYMLTMAIMMAQSGPKIVQAGRWSERMNREAAAYLEGQPVVRVFGGAAASGFRARLGEYIAFLNAWQRPFTGKKTLMDLATRPSTFLWLIAAVGTLLITTGGMQPVTLLPFLLLGTSFGARLLGIGYGLGGIRDGMLAGRRIQVALDETELGHGDAETATPDRPGRVEFDDVVFGYKPGIPVIHNVSLSLAPGTVTALVGPSGSGKSTLAALLARFHDVDSGRIRVGGRDLRSLTADELYSRVGFVLQDAQLVNGSVRDNIALAAPDASDAQIEQAARAAHIHERITRLPAGYDTVLGAGSALSGGERQRITIARAILADTPILVLDEATALADPESEYLVQRALNRLTAGRTVLVIAHRLHTITGADAIVVLDHGRVVEAGVHDELMASNGRYRTLWDAGSHADSTETQEVLG